MVLDFEENIVIAIIISVTICFVIKYGLSFYIKLKELNKIKHFNDLYSSYLNRLHLDNTKGSDFDIDKDKAKN